jgi:[calcium/calmodulin-dependent protein kinase] kinase
MADNSQEHPWVTKNGTDPLLPAEENTADLVEPPSDIEVNHAITTKMRNLVVLVRIALFSKNRIY